jgi:hypothetical protein
VPAETREAAILTRAIPSRGVGMGTSSIVVFPFLTFWRSCFIVMYDLQACLVHALDFLIEKV